MIPTFGGADLTRERTNALDNIGDFADLVVTGIPRPLRWQPDSHLDSGGSNHLDLQPGLWPAFGLSRDDTGKTAGSKPSKSGARGST